MPVHVSIHDVSPASAHEVEAALGLCHACGIQPALLVVPDFHREAPLLDDARFCARLRDLQAAGHEIYLHGFFHQSRPRYAGMQQESVLAYDRTAQGTPIRPGDAQRSPPGVGDPFVQQAAQAAFTRGAPGWVAWVFAQRVVSGGEAEMSDVSESEGRARVEEGERVLEAAGLRVDGFVAPAWSMPPWLLALLGARGYRFTEDHLRVHDPLMRRSRPSVVLNWATRSPARLLSTVAFCRAAKFARTVLPARIAIHPGDMRFVLVRNEVRHFLRWASGDVIARGADFFL
jgi:predicted deacetylase